MMLQAVEESQCNLDNDQSSRSCLLFFCKVYFVYVNLMLKSRPGKNSGFEEPNRYRKSSTEPEPKLIKYSNGFKILVSKEPNSTRTKVSRYITYL